MEPEPRTFTKLAEKLKAIAHPQRLCIVRGLLEDACNVTKIQHFLNIPQSTVSQHLIKLKAAGIIEGERNGLEICYQVIDKKMAEVVKLLLKE